jgi:multiple sugar transport system ATP-binding protein
MAELLEITDVLDDTPDEMSGGQKQRVALGRAIVREPDVFLLDEPLSNLDAKLRAEMRRELQRIHRTLDITTIYVTHDQTEAMTMSDRIAVMRDGRLQQLADPDTAYDRPANRFVGEFLGSPSMNTAESTLAEADDGWTVRFLGQELATIPPASIEGAPGSVVVGVRPEDVVVSIRPEDVVADGPGDVSVEAAVREVEYQGSGNFLFLRVGETDLTVRTPVSVRPSPGDTVSVAVDRDDVYLFDAESGEAVRPDERVVP